MFDRIFDEAQSIVNEIVYCAVCGKDGLILEHKIYNQSKGIEPELLSAEMAEIAVKNDALAVTPGSYYSEYILENRLMSVFSLSNEYYLLIVAEDSVIRGRLRFYVEMILDPLKEIL